MNRRLVLSASADARLAAARGWLAGFDATEECLVVAPSRGAADDLLRRACTQGGGLFGAHRATPLQLAAELATLPLAEDGLAPVSPLGIEALAARVITRCHAAGEVDYFAPVVETPGLARALGGTLRELRAERVDPAALAATGPPGADLARWLTAYREELERWSLADQTSVFDFAQSAVESSAHPFLGLPLLLLDLSPRGAGERDFLRALAACSPAVFASVTAGDPEGRAALESILDSPAEDLDAGEVSTRLERLRRHVFKLEIAGEEPAADDTDQSVVFLTAPGEGRECIEMARRIRDLAADGVPFDQIAVLLRDPDVYLPLIEEAFSRAGIPAFFTRGTVRPHPSGRAFLALLASAAEDYSAARFAEYLSLGQIPELDAAGAPPAVEEVPWVEPMGDQLVFKSFVSRRADPTSAEQTETADEAETAGEAETGGEAEIEVAADGEVIAVAGTLQTPRRWEQILVDAAVLGGRERWERRLDGLAAEIAIRLHELGDAEAARRDRLLKQARQLENLKRFALPVIDALAALPEEGSWGTWLDALARLAKRVLRYSDQVLEVLADLRPMERVAPVTLDEVRRVLEERLTFLRGEPPPRRYGRVLVATLDEARGRSFHTVFLPALAEGLFPRRANEDPLLLDVHRQALREAGDEASFGMTLATQDERVARERSLLHIAAGAAADKLIVSYPNLDPAQGRARVPSFYALDVLRAAEGRLPDLRQLEKRAVRESASRLGWPAPRHAERAVDDAEFDLAILSGLLAAESRETVTSRGRYMLEWNAPLKRSLRTRWLRWRPGFTAADGLVAPDEATGRSLAQNRLDARSYSPTALQSYAACPYRFLLYSIHRLRPRDEVAPLEQLDPLTRGSLFHEVQFRFLVALREAELLPMREADLAELFERADRTLAEVAAEYREKLAPAIPRVYDSEIENLATDLRGWVRTLVALPDDEKWRPSYFELSFGLPLARDHDEASHREPVEIMGGKKLRGSIDVVEIDEKRGAVRVVDHKTGRPILKRHLVVGGGETLQPLLYGLAVERLMGREVESGRLFYCTRRGDYHVLEVPLTDQTRRDITQVLTTIDRAVENGFFPAAPRENACRWCDYRLVCGPLEELRLDRKRRARKLPQEFAELEKLRGMA